MKKEKPTYEEKLQALKESIEHWEEVAEDPTTEDVGSHHCPLCTSFLSYSCDGCPVAEKTGYVCSPDGVNIFSGCKNTPYEKFYYDRAKENALAEVVFLKNLYIEMLEKGKPRNFCVDCCHWIGNKCIFTAKCDHRPSKTKEKKEEWVDVTEEIEWKISEFVCFNSYWVIGEYEEEEIVYHNGNGLYFNGKKYEENFKIEMEQDRAGEDMGGFNILKKVS